MKFKNVGVLLMALVICFTVSCKKGDKKAEVAEKSAASEYPWSNKALAIVEPTEGHKTSGSVSFTKVADGVKVEVNLTGLTPGKHGFHIHEKPKCSNNGKDAGGHFNPLSQSHGDRTAKVRHVGDLGNITADKNGVAKMEFIDKTISINLPNSIVIRALIIHEKADEFSQPTGNAGSRVGCGNFLYLELVAPRWTL